MTVLWTYEHYRLPEDGMTMNIFVHINALSILNVLRKKDKLPKLSYLIAFIYVITITITNLFKVKTPLCVQLTLQLKYT